MLEQQDILISTSFLLKAPRDTKEMEQFRDRIAARMREAVENALKSEGVEFSQECTSFHYLDGSADGDENARRCFYCSAWATDWSTLAAINGLMPGCELDGRWVCDQCIEHHDKLFGHTT
jgi:hypothetical protein